MSTKVITGPVRLSYPRLFEPVAREGSSDKKYSVLLLIPKTDKKTLKAIKKAQAEALEIGIQSKFGGKEPKGLKYTLHDGDDSDVPEQQGHMIMSVSSSESYPPGLVDRQGNKLLDRSEIYPGVWAVVSISAFAYSNSGNKGISFGLNHVMKWRDDESFTGSSRAEDDFADLIDAEDDLDDEDDDLI